MGAHGIPASPRPVILQLGFIEASTFGPEAAADHDQIFYLAPTDTPTANGPQRPIMFLNVMHRSASGPKYSIFREQQHLVHRLGLRCTVFIHYRDLFDDAVLKDVLADARDHGDEIGLALHDMSGPDTHQLVSNLPAIWLLSEARKREVLSIIFARYRAVLGRAPTAVASYHFDSSALQALKEVAPEVTTVVGGCFEEGVRVFHGCNHSWYLFNEGMPWNPWYPSRTHTLRPATDADDSAGVVAVPHLVRDMSLSYEGRNDFWASHPPNVVRGMGNDASFNPYDLNLVDQYRLQEDYNGGYSYLNTFVGVNWLTWNHNSEYPPEVCWHLYRTYLGYLAELKRDGAVRDMTLSQYGAWHAANRRFATPEVYFAKEMLYGSGKHYFWYIDGRQRCLIDATQGGSIGDLRAYVGRVPVATGPDTPHREIGSYPYLVQSQHRTGYAHHHEDGARTTLQIEHAGELVDLSSCRTRVASVDRSAQRTVVELTPASFRFKDGLAGEIITHLTFAHNGGTIEIRRQIRGLNRTARLRLIEHLKAAPGRTEYAEDLHGIVLAARRGDDALRELTFDYSGQMHRITGATVLEALLPSIRTRLSLAAAGSVAPTLGTLKCGNLFSPYLTLQLHYDCPGTGEIQTQLTLSSFGT